MAAYKKITVENGQTLIDICRQHCGADEALVDVVNINNLPSYSHIPKPGSILKIFDPVPAYNSNNLNIIAYYQANNLKIASGFKAPPPSGAPILVDNGNLITTEDGRIITVEAPSLITENGEVITTEGGEIIH